MKIYRGEVKEYIEKYIFKPALETEKSLDELGKMLDEWNERKTRESKG